MAGQLAVAIGRSPDRDRLEIRLDPPELGRVQIHLIRHDGALQALVMADRPETQDLLRRNAEALARELGEAGYDSVSLDFAGGEARAGRDDQRAMDWAQLTPGSAEATASAEAPASAGGGPSGLLSRAPGALDIRL